MSLKAKLEAVIYAAEEPVTLAQLAGMFADEALEWKAEREAAAAAVNEAAPPLSTDALGYLGLEEGAAANDAAVADETGAENTASAEPVAEGDATSASQEPRTTVGEDTGGTTEQADGTSEEVSTAGQETSALVKEAPSLAPGSVDGGEAAPEVASEAGESSEGDEVERAKQLARQREREARAAINEILGELIAEYAPEGRGIEIREIAGGYRMATKPEFHDAVRAFVKSQKPPLKLSRPALETLAVIAYKQPVTAPEVNEIRGVDSSAVFGSLLARKLITTAGRKPVVGRPILYKTTREFLLSFGLKDVSDLPSMEEFEKMAASELEADMPLEEAAPEAEEFTADPSVELEAAEAVAAETAATAEAESNFSGGAEGGAAHQSSGAAETSTAE